MLIFFPKKSTVLTRDLWLSFFLRDIFHRKFICSKHLASYSEQAARRGDVFSVWVFIFSNCGHSIMKTKIIKACTDALVYFWKTQAP